jgi:hypothetical protein
LLDLSCVCIRCVPSSNAFRWNLEPTPRITVEAHRISTDEESRNRSYDSLLTALATLSILRTSYRIVLVTRNRQKLPNSNRNETALSLATFVVGRRRGAHKFHPGGCLLPPSDAGTRSRTCGEVSCEPNAEAEDNGDAHAAPCWKRRGRRDLLVGFMSSTTLSVSSFSVRFLTIALVSALFPSL